LGFGALSLAVALHRGPAWLWATVLNPCKTHHWVWAATIGYGFALMIWIVTEVIVIGLDSWLQPFHFAIGLTFALLPLAPSARGYFRLA
ncbi:MAG TPA: hypothetical protein VKP30_10270, partial [Polyangiaceae bacterium]|nr:hypothetical protein [Polyangiaceae bacterium]